MVAASQRTIATCGIWASTALILVGGVYRMSGEMTFFVLTTMIVMVCAMFATVAVWMAGNQKQDVSPGFDVIPTAGEADRK